MLRVGANGYPITTLTNTASLGPGSQKPSNPTWPTSGSHGPDLGGIQQVEPGFNSAEMRGLFDDTPLETIKPTTFSDAMAIDKAWLDNGWRTSDWDPENPEVEHTSTGIAYGKLQANNSDPSAAARYVNAVYEEAAYCNAQPSDLDALHQAATQGLQGAGYTGDINAAVTGGDANFTQYIENFKTDEANDFQDEVPWAGEM